MNALARIFTAMVKVEKQRVNKYAKSLRVEKPRKTKKRARR